MIKIKFLSIVLIIVIVASIVTGSLQIWIMYDCLSQGGKVELLSCTGIFDELSENESRSKLLIQSKSLTVLVYVEIADDKQEQVQGLMFRENLDWNSGMFFVFDSERPRSFWMKNTLIPLDMLFIDKNLRIVDIKENAVPCIEETCLIYISEKPAKYVLEVNSGFVMKNNIKLNDGILFNP